MGRFVKNYALHAASYAIQLPVGTNSLGPQFPQDGQIRFNASADNFEVFYNSSWKPMALTGRVAIVRDLYYGAPPQVTFPITNTYAPGHEAEMLVFVGGVYQNSNEAYTVSGYEITFTSVPDLNVPVVILHNFNSTHVQ
jgi:hypothetical protein